MKKSTKQVTTATLALVMVPLSVLPAFAHIDGSGGSGFAFGFSHPFSGIDHLVAIMGVGALAALRGGRATIAISLTFIAAMIVGALLPIIGFKVPGAELMIVISLLAVGLFLVLGNRLALPAVVAAAGVFALFHGVAHGNEMAVSATPMNYVVGFVVAGTLLLSLGGAAAVLTGRAVKSVSENFVPFLR